MEHNNQIPIAIIGGTGLYNIPSLKIIEEIDIETDWGSPSDTITIAEATYNNNTFNIAFLPRHGKGHFLAPSKIPQKANMAALKMLGVEHIIAFSAVGSLKQDIEPTHFVVPNQIIDRTRHREDTFYNEGVVVHCSFGEPFCSNLANIVENTLKEMNIKYHTNETLICMEGPTFSTRSESRLYKYWGAGIINMTTLPEAKLARELEIAYQVICMSTDYDSWRDESEAVSTNEIMKVVSSNSQKANSIIEHLIPQLSILAENPSSLKNTLQNNIITVPDKRNKETCIKLNKLLPTYF